VLGICWKKKEEKKKRMGHDREIFEQIIVKECLKKNASNDT
jgi:hypothetical protein